MDHSRDHPLTVSGKSFQILSPWSATSKLARAQKSKTLIFFLGYEVKCVETMHFFFKNSNSTKMERKLKGLPIIYFEKTKIISSTILESFKNSLDSS